MLSSRVTIARSQFNELFSKGVKGIQLRICVKTLLNVNINDIAEVAQFFTRRKSTVLRYKLLFVGVFEIWLLGLLLILKKMRPELFLTNCMILKKSSSWNSSFHTSDTSASTPEAEDLGKAAKFHRKKKGLPISRLESWTFGTFS